MCGYEKWNSLCETSQLTTHASLSRQAAGSEGGHIPGNYWWRAFREARLCRSLERNRVRISADRGYPRNTCSLLERWDPGTI